MINNMTKNVVFAKNYGFCFGVKRAFESLIKIKGQAFTYGPIIHNPQVVEYFKKRGIQPIEDLSKIRKGQKLFIRAHGVPRDIIDMATRKGLVVFDLTCPYVKKSQVLAQHLEKKNYKIFIIGQKKHPEVKAILGNVKKAIVIENFNEAKTIKKQKKIGIICQTTSNIAKTKKIINELKKKSTLTKVFDTICQATKERQAAAIQLAKKSDMVIVIGGKNSSNTKKLQELCKKYVPTHQIETALELNKNWFINKKMVGITAGASTPNWIISQIARKIKTL